MLRYKDTNVEVKPGDRLFLHRHKMEGQYVVESIKPDGRVVIKEWGRWRAIHEAVLPCEIGAYEHEEQPC